MQSFLHTFTVTDIMEKKFPFQSSEKHQPKNWFPLYWKAFEIYIRYSDGKFLFELLHNYL